MVVVAIIGVLAAIGIPTYEDYVKRSKLAELMLHAGACRGSVTEVVASTTASTLPLANGWGCQEGNSNVSRYISALATTDAGAITVTARNIGSGVDGLVLTMTPYIDTAGGLALANADVGARIAVWKCSGTIDLRLLPLACR